MEHHVIAYYKEEDVRSHRLQRPAVFTELAIITIPSKLVRLTEFRHPLCVELGVDGQDYM